MWKQNCPAANMPQHRQLAEVQKTSRVEKIRNRQREKELRCKDKALAETTALLYYRENLSPFGAKEEDRPLTRSG